MCTWREGGGAGHNTVIASKTGPETINRDSGWNSLFFLFVVLCCFLTKAQTTRIVTVTVQVDVWTLNFSRDRDACRKIFKEIRGRGILGFEEERELCFSI